jgi:hypothetical protein
MTKYEEMREAAVTEVRKFHERQRRCLKCGIDLVNGFISYCGIPNEQLKLMRWNGPTHSTPFEEAEPGKKFTMAGAMQISEEDQYWRFGVHLVLNWSQSIYFALGVADRDGKTMVRLGDDKPQPIDFSDQNQCKAFYDVIVEMVKDCYRDGKPSRKAIGFETKTSDSSEVDAPPSPEMEYIKREADKYEDALTNTRTAAAK